MRFLVDMRLTESARPKPPEDRAHFVKTVVFPTLTQCNKLAEEGKIVAGGPASAQIRLILVIEAASALELDEMIERLPVWALTETTVTPLTTFEDRRTAILGLLESHSNEASGRSK